MKPINTKWFSLVELIVVMTILSILSTIATISYSSYITDSRDSTRVSDINQLKIQLKSNKQKTGAHPMPGNYFQIINSWSSNIVAYQGTFDSSISVNSINLFPKDPKTNLYYGYSVTKNKQSYQLATTLENGWSMKAYIDGDYKGVAMNVLPSLFLAMTGSSSTQIEIQNGVTSAWSVGSSNRIRFILHNWTYNLLYDPNGKLITNSTVDFTGILNQPWVQLTGNTSYISCQDIYESGRAVGPGEYQILGSDGIVTNTGCLMNPPSY